MSVVAPLALHVRTERLATALQAARIRVAGVLADNSATWVALDLAAQQVNATLVPLPLFFTPAQWSHAVEATGMDALFCEDERPARELGFDRAGEIGGLRWFRRHAPPAALPLGTAKVTFTSGTTGAPKGVPLTASLQWSVARSLADLLRPLRIRRHLCLLPLAVLLENVAGVYAAQLLGAECCVPPLAHTGLGGAASFDPRRCLETITQCEAESVILLPQMLQALTAAIESGAGAPLRLKFVAVGGARVARGLLLRARAAGLPVYEGYGLSECASVVSLNLPGADRAGSVGRPLSHVDVRIVEGEICVRTNGAWILTGDLGRLDRAGFLYVEGRRSDVLITTFGRNVSPEWPEAELLGAGSAIQQAMVFGEAKPALGAIIVADTPDEAIEAQLEVANARLPDYARIARWMRADAPFTAANGLATANGRPRRAAILKAYANRLDVLL